MEPGIYYNISNEDYHNGEGVSKSNLDDIAKCPAIYQWKKKAPECEEQKQALNMGTALHCLLLEPQHFESRFSIMPKYDLRTKEGKEGRKQFMDEYYSPDKIIITEDEMQKLQLMRQSALAHPDAKKLLEMQGECEASLYWNDFETDVLCKIRPDKIVYINGKPIIVDIKKTSNINDFGRSIEDYRYHVQAAMYIDGGTEIFKITPTFLFIAISDVADGGRYPVRVFQLDEHDLGVGYELYRENLLTFANSLKHNSWDGIETIQRPQWIRRYEND